MQTQMTIVVNNVLPLQSPDDVVDGQAAVVEVQLQGVSFDQSDYEGKCDQAASCKQISVFLTFLIY